MAAVMPPALLAAMSDGLVREVVGVVSDWVSSTLSARRCPWGRNRVKAIEAGAVDTLAELLLDEGGRRVTELPIVAIDHL
ncbi:hypothetical protein BS78_01G178000 [Paspalum vaginatum]|nr:hypothetical protein BS78_01G178000 [Paspalum vaginatum]